MSEEFLNLIQSAQDLPQPKPKIGPVSFQELISFKEELLKDLIQYKSKMTKNINDEFEKYSQLIEKTNNKMNFIQNEKSSLILKSEFVQEKNNILSEISSKHLELKKQIMVNEVQTTTIKKDLEEFAYRYDKAIKENLQIPGLVGNSCRFPNLKEYILSNKDEISNAGMINKQTSMEFKSFKKRMEMNINQIFEKIKAQEFKFSNSLNSKFNELKDKFEGLYEALNDKINNISNDLNVGFLEKNKEIEKVNILIYENKKKMIEKNEKLKEEFLIEIEGIQKSFHKIKKNIVNLSKLLSGKNTGLNKQMVITKFNNMMKNLYKEVDPNEINIENNNNEIININNNNINNNNNNLNNSLNLTDKKKPHNKNNIKEKKLSSFGKGMNKGIIKSSISSSIKDYIEGKISANDAKFNAEIILKNKQLHKLNNKGLLSLKKETNKNMSSANNINTFNNKKINPRLSLKLNTNYNLIKDIKDIKDIHSSFYENNKTIDRDMNKERDSLILDIKVGNSVKNIKNTIKNEIINEEDSKYNSSEESRKKKKKRHTKDYSEFNNKKLHFSIKKEINKKNESESNDFSSSSKKTNNSLDSSKYLYNNTNTNNENENHEINTLNNNNITINNSFNQINDSIDLKNKDIKESNIHNENPNQNQFINNTLKNINNNNSSKQINNINDSRNNNVKGINNYYEKAIYNIIHNTNHPIFQEKDQLINNDIKSILTTNEKNEKNEKSEILTNKIIQASKINLKKKFETNTIKDNNTNNKYNLLTLNNINKKNEIIQISPNQINPKKMEMLQTICANQQNKNNSPLKLITNNSFSKNVNNICKNIEFQNKDLMIKTTRNKASNINNNFEKETHFSSFDGKKNLLKINNNNNDIQGYKSCKKENEYKIKLNHNYIDKLDKDIYIDNNIFKNIRFIKDEEIIDKPLLLNRNNFKMDKNKGVLENRIIELEYFTKKKFDELVKEIKNFIPIHFNSHLRDYQIK